MTKVSKEIDDMVATPVSPVGTSECTTPTVNVFKAKGSSRICGNYSSTINPNCMREIYPLPSVQDILNNLAAGKCFTKLLLSETFLQVTIDEETSKVLTLTRRGLYKVNSLPPGLSFAPAIFQKIMEGLVGDTPGTVVYMDDLLIQAPMLDVMWNRVRIVLKILQSLGFKLRVDKCSFAVQQLEYVGYMISGEGVSQLRKKIEPFLKVRNPKDAGELQVYLGFVYYYDRFLPHKSSMLHPLFSLTQKDVP
jgi:hypothetical protein